MCCDEFLFYGCFNLCDLIIANSTIIAPVTGDYTLKQANNSYIKEQTVAAIEDEALEWDNTFPVGITQFQIFLPSGELMACYYVKIERGIEECPEITQPEKELSPC